jgi:hypothetical protein
VRELYAHEQIVFDERRVRGALGIAPVGSWTTTAT